MHELDLLSEQRQLTQGEKLLKSKTRADFWKYSKGGVILEAKNQGFHGLSLEIKTPNIFKL